MFASDLGNVGPGIPVQHFQRQKFGRHGCLKAREAGAS